MNNFLDNDLLFLIGLIFLTKFVENLDPWITITGGIIVIILGIFKTIDIYFSIKEKRFNIKLKQKQLEK